MTKWLILAVLLFLPAIASAATIGNVQACLAVGPAHVVPVRETAPGIGVVPIDVVPVTDNCVPVRVAAPGERAVPVVVISGSLSGDPVVLLETGDDLLLETGSKALLEG